MVMRSKTCKSPMPVTPVVPDPQPMHPTGGATPGVELTMGNVIFTNCTKGNDVKRANGQVPAASARS